MPLYEYKCWDCGQKRVARRPVDQRDEPLWCDADGEVLGRMDRIFTPTTTITIPAAFGVNQRDFAPPREAREYLGNDSQSHAPRQESFEKFLERDLRA